MVLRKSLVLLPAFALSACASIVEGTDQSIAVNLSPENATCAVYREGAQLSTISKDHRFINISKSKNDLVIECEAPDYHDEAINLESSASGWGVVGCFLIDLCITDYSTGALNKYPETITITLAPKSFESAESRDEWYRDRRAAVEGRWDELLDAKASECRAATNKDECEARVTALEERKAEELQGLEQRRTASAVRSPMTQSATIESRLAEIKDLLDRGIITQPEYDAKRRDILSEL